MSAENDFHFAEYAKPAAKKGKTLLTRRLLVLAYILFALAFTLLFVTLNIPQVIAIMPVFVWMLVFFTWKMVSYECCVRVSSSKVSLLKLYGKKEKLLYSFDAHNIVFGLPYNENCRTKVQAENPDSVLDLRADPDEEGFAVLVKEQNGSHLVVFECTAAVASAMRYYNKSVIADKSLFRH